MQVQLGAIWGFEEGIYALAEFGLVEATCDGSKELACESDTDDAQWLRGGCFTDQELGGGLFVDGPSFCADSSLERRVYWL